VTVKGCGAILKKDGKKIMYGEYERILDNTFVAYFEVVTQQTPGKTEENQVNTYSK
jgi:hypothetical protein